MKSFLVALALVGSLLLPQTIDADDIGEDVVPFEQAAVAKAVNDVFEAFEQGDAERLEALHLYGPKFSKFDDVPPLTRQDAAFVREKERAALSSLKTFSATVEDLKVDVFGSVAVATFIARYSFEAAEVNGSGSARSTMVFVKKTGAWRIAHEHFSRLVEAE